MLDVPSSVHMMVARGCCTPPTLPRPRSRKNTRRGCLSRGNLTLQQKTSCSPERSPCPLVAQRRRFNGRQYGKWRPTTVGAVPRPPRTPREAEIMRVKILSQLRTPHAARGRRLSLLNRDPFGESTHRLEPYKQRLEKCGYCRSHEITYVCQLLVLSRRK